MDQGRAILSYLGLPEDYTPSPTNEPIEFLKRHLRYTPPHLITSFSTTTTPKQRTVIPAVRNRRSRYTESNPSELQFTAAKSTWPTLWEGRELRGKDEAKEEEEWAQKSFLEGPGKGKMHVGKLGTLLGGYEEEREAERVRGVRRREAEERDALPEEDEDTDDEEFEEEMRAAASTAPVEESPEEMKAAFLRVVKERFIYGLLENIDYDKVDWDERWDVDNDRDEEERWFDEEEESMAMDEE
ncbi:hypothetical protein EIP91_003486 [Steccherinum ochraceum]|uniref:CCD97-like C-terminal domain-containing protein n=1 Tax=Steccherinum ochraceum TaxID=92696 RepID=A0A4R0RUV1_9APHY|nr:hypothetical protein EIP91_003486 [Steccherinum ochraceum]